MNGAVNVRFFRHPTVVLMVAGMLILLAGCKGKDKHTLTHPIRKQLMLQLENSCRIPGISYHKSVTDLQTDPPVTEDTIYQPVPEIIISRGKERDSISWLLIQDMGYALDQFYDAPYIRDYLTVSQHQDTLIATINPGAEMTIPLHLQKVSTNTRGYIKYFEVTTHKKNWLYTVTTHIAVSFDSVGVYQHHSLSLFTRVPMIRQEVKADITGKAQYP
ncbi:MAG: hypothetical protein R3D00_10135 [Bacteroidia bacterium]